MWFLIMVIDLIFNLGMFFCDSFIYKYLMVKWKFFIEYFVFVGFCFVYIGNKKYKFIFFFCFVWLVRKMVYVILKFYEFVREVFLLNVVVVVFFDFIVWDVLFIWKIIFKINNKLYVIFEVKFVIIYGIFGYFVGDIKVRYWILKMFI